MERFTAVSFSGAKLNIYRTTPTNRPKAVVHISHGMAEHAKRYAWFMQVLKEAGYAVYAHDIRGMVTLTRRIRAKGISQINMGLINFCMTLISL